MMIVQGGALQKITIFGFKVNFCVQGKLLLDPCFHLIQKHVLMNIFRFLDSKMYVYNNYSPKAK